VNSLRQHMSELEISLNDQKIDICLISETHFTKSYFNIHVKLIILFPINKTRGGTAVIIRSNIKHHEKQ